MAYIVCFDTELPVNRKTKKWQLQNFTDIFLIYSERIYSKS